MGIRGDSVLVPGRPFFWIYADVQAHEALLGRARPEELVWGVCWAGERSGFCWWGGEHTPPAVLRFCACGQHGLQAAVGDGE